MSTNLLFFGIYPYVALLICLVGSWARFDLSQYTWKAGSSQMLSKKGMRVYSNLFHVGVLFILAGHFCRPADPGLGLPPPDQHREQATAGDGLRRLLRRVSASSAERIDPVLPTARVRATGNAL